MIDCSRTSLFFKNIAMLCHVVKRPSACRRLKITFGLYTVVVRALVNDSLLRVGTVDHCLLRLKFSGRDDCFSLEFGG